MVIILPSNHTFVHNYEEHTIIVAFYGFVKAKAIEHLQLFRSAAFVVCQVHRPRSSNISNAETEASL
jgi:hypothetical protein